MRIENQTTERLDQAEMLAEGLAKHLSAIVALSDDHRWGLTASQCGDIYDRLLEACAEELDEDCRGYSLIQSLTLAAGRPALSPLDVIALQGEADDARVEILAREAA
jgi:hypothetical protein